MPLILMAPLNFLFSPFPPIPALHSPGLISTTSHPNYEEFQFKVLQEPRLFTWGQPGEGAGLEVWAGSIFPGLSPLPQQLLQQHSLHVSSQVLTSGNAKSLLGAAKDSTASLQLSVSAQQGTAWREGLDGYRTFKQKSYLSRRSILCVLAASHSHFSSLSNISTARHWRFTLPSRHIYLKFAVIYSRHGNNSISLLLLSKIKWNTRHTNVTEICSPPSLPPPNPQHWELHLLRVLPTGSHVVEISRQCRIVWEHVGRKQLVSN